MKKKFFIFFLSIFIFGFFLGMYFHSKRYFPVNQLSGLKNKFSNYLNKPNFQNWNPLRESFKDKLKKTQLSEHLNAIGYASGTRLPPETENTVLFYNSSQTYEGFNFYVSGHGPEITLIDMKGKVLHQWKVSLSYLEEHFKEELEALSSIQKPSFRRAYLYENGDVLGIISGLALFKLDKDSNILWTYKERVHHDLYVEQSGKIYTLINKYHKVTDFEEPIMEDFICVLDVNGNVQKSISLLDAFKNSNYCYMLSILSKDFIQKSRGDIFHTNSLELLQKPLSPNTSFFHKGLILLSIRTFDAICLLDLEKKEIVWAQKGMWKMQHEATIIGDERFLLFDNRGISGASRILEFNPLTQEIFWKYQGTDEFPFYSDFGGTAERLPNGNTLITESDAGRCIEVNSKKEIVWEFISPHRVGEDQSKVIFIASLFNMTRLAPNFPLSWLFE